MQSDSNSKLKSLIIALFVFGVICIVFGSVEFLLTGSARSIIFGVLPGIVLILISVRRLKGEKLFEMFILACVLSMYILASIFISWYWSIFAILAAAAIPITHLLKRRKLWLKINSSSL